MYLLVNGASISRIIPAVVSPALSLTLLRQTELSGYCSAKTRPLDVGLEKRLAGLTGLRWVVAASI